MKPLQLLFPAILIAFFGALTWSLLRPVDPNAKGSPLVGNPAPDFKLETLQGGFISLSSLKGKAVIVNFWASWCLPCREEAPLLRDVQDQFANQGLVLVGIIVSDKPENSRKFVAEFGLNYPNLIDPAGKVGVNYGVTGVPETFFVNRAGKIIFKKFGPFEATELERHIKEIL